MKPLVALVGRPNVGKSTLFNRLIGERRAIVLDTPGVTRDRHYGESHWAGRDFMVVDTGGFEPRAEEGILAAMRRQAMAAIEQADVVIFVTDGKEGLIPADHEVAGILRRAKDRVICAVNKIDGQRQDDLVAEFYALGIEHLFGISAEHGRTVNFLLDAAVSMFPEADDEDEDEEGRVTRVALVGRPNVGKSTLANRLLGEERMIVDAEAGTTRDAVDSPLYVGDREYLLVDTAGLRKKNRIDRRSSEGFSVVRTLQAIDRCHVAVLLLDATEGATEQDARIAGYTMEKGRALVLVVNKWDAIEKDEKTAKLFVEQITQRLPFVTYAPILFTSGLTGQRVHKLMATVDAAREAHLLRIPTGPLNRWLQEATAAHHPPVARGRPVRLYYATQPRVAPPTIMISTNEPEGVHFSYQRYLLNQLREAFPLEGTPVRLQFKGKANPFVDGDEEG
ncbi:MAG: ribosome biogenesis GTPase Der [Myxococcales bacterium]|nr:ribosome biogenesis GTPase Der [Myxococcales bacterium]MCB9544817.1 ribosome biogenesis GTPase Der [Myxococcales bacterium]